MKESDKNRRWYVYAKKADFAMLAKEHGISPVTARIMINRGVKPEEFDEFLHGSINYGSLNPEQPQYDSHALLDMDIAADIIEDAIATGQKIRIVGDYDIDGVCSTVILLKAFNRLGGLADYDIPDRVKDGYGINDRIIEKAISDGVELIVTCDNGISACDTINKAAEQGIAVVITDHHEVPDILPEADAIVDPKQPGDTYPFKDICGAFVAFKLVRLLYERAGIIRTAAGRENCMPDSEAGIMDCDKPGCTDNNELRELIIFASIATVGDVMPLIKENRALVKCGLKLLAETDNIGLNALIDACGVRKDRISAYTIGFVLGPCINAGGRLKTARTAIELLVTDDADRARSLALKLKELNDERKDLTEHFAAEAAMQVEKNYADSNVLVLYLKDCHESVAGIIAGRIKEKYHRPVIVLTDTENGDGLAKGSARSIESYDMYTKLTEVSDLMVKFGGHRLAAGMTLKSESIDEFRSRLNSGSGLTPEDLKEKLWIDVTLPFSYATAEQSEELELLEPFGQGNERPVFAQRNVTVLSKKTFPGYKNIVKLKLRDENGFICDGVIFSDADETLKCLAEKDHIDILYYPRIDYYGGRKNVQIQIKAFK